MLSCPQQPKEEKMVQKKAPLSLKEFMASSLIINYPCNRSSAKKAPHMVDAQDVLSLCKKLKGATKYGNMYPTQYPDKGRA